MFTFRRHLCSVLSKSWPQLSSKCLLIVASSLLSSSVCPRHAPCELFYTVVPMASMHSWDWKLGARFCRCFFIFETYAKAELSYVRALLISASENISNRRKKHLSSLAQELRIKLAVAFLSALLFLLLAFFLCAATLLFIISITDILAYVVTPVMV